MPGVTPYVTRAALSPLAYAPTLMLSPAPPLPPSPSYTVAMQAWPSGSIAPPPSPSPSAPSSVPATGAWTAMSAAMPVAMPVGPSQSPFGTPPPSAAATGAWPAMTTVPPSSPFGTPSPARSSPTAVTGAWPAAAVALAPLVPASTLARPPHAPSAARWLWLLPVLAIVVGVALLALR